MPEFKIILVGTEYDMNLGYAARVVKNFGFTEMRLVSPKAEKGKNAIKYAKHARDVLEAAKIFPSIREAAADCDFIVGTSGVLIRSKETLRSPIPLPAFMKRAKKMKGAFAILVGREGIGLSTKELKECDFITTIPASAGYPVLNVTHALAILLYELSGASMRATDKGEFIPLASKAEKARLEEVFSRLVDRSGGKMRNPEKAKLAFKRLLGRALASDLEVRAILSALSRLPGARARGKKDRGRGKPA